MNYSVGVLCAGGLLGYELQFVAVELLLNVLHFRWFAGV